MQFEELTYLLSPIVLILTALFVLIIDFFVKRKVILMLYALFGMFISASILIIQFFNFETSKSIFFSIRSMSNFKTSIGS